MIDKKYGYIYKFTLIPTGKIYVGKRKAKKFDENYYGSGCKWKPLVEEYGKENIKREILEWCGTDQELNSRERYWIKELDSRNSDIGYNISAGGHNPVLYGESNPNYGKPKNNEWKKKFHKSIKKHYELFPVTEETRRKLSESHKGKPANNLGKKSSIETRKKISNIVSGKIHINNGYISKMIKPEDLIYYENNGWVRGRLTSGRVHVANGVEEKVIKKEELDYYLQNGYHTGRLKETGIKITNAQLGKIVSDETKSKLRNKNLGMKMMNNGSEQHWIYPNEIDQKLKDGWVFGRLKH